MLCIVRLAAVQIVSNRRPKGNKREQKHQRSYRASKHEWSLPLTEYSNKDKALSHIVSIKTQVKDANAVRSACNRLQLPQPVQGAHRLFSGEVDGLGVELPDWRYPVVAQLETGELRYDNYNGRWGEQQHLDRLLQTYAIEKATIEARRKGHSVTEQRLDNGSVKLTINVGGAS